jgi:hypothetical protein
MKHFPTYLFLCFALAACGSEDPSADDGGGSGGSGGGSGSSTETLLPWKTGNRWTYQVTKKGEVTTKETTVGEEEPVGGNGPNKDVLALKVVTMKKDGTDKTVSWQAVEGNRVVRYREQSFAKGTDDLDLEEHWAPHKLHIDWSPERTEAGASWLEEYEETKLPVGDTKKTSTRRDRWTVVATGEELTVPAGTFQDVVVFQKVGGSTSKTYYYARGVGKLKETGGQTEELVDYELVE